MSIRKKVLWAAILYQFYLVTRATGVGSEALLGARAIGEGLIPYRDFMLHIGPVPSYLFAFLNQAWQSLVFIVFNLLSALGLYYLSRKELGEDDALKASVIFLFVAPLYGANEMYPEVMLTTFGVWGIYFAGERNYLAAIPFLLLAGFTKQTGFLFSLASLFA